MTRRTAVRVSTLFGLLAGLAAAVPFGARMFEGTHGTPVPQLASFAPWSLPLWLIAGVLLLIGRTRRTAVGLLVVLVLVLALGLRWQLPPTAARDAAGSPGGDVVGVRLMTLNVHLGRANAGQTVDLVKKQQVDVLVVEELTPAFVARMQAAGIDGLLGYHDLHPHGQASGTGIWSRMELQPSGSLTTAGHEMPSVTIDLPGNGDPKLNLTAVHPRSPKGSQIPQWRQDLSLIALAHSSGAPNLGPTIYAGDFNATRDQSEFRTILASGLVDAADAVGGPPWTGFTWPADGTAGAVVRIDHVLVSPDSVGVNSVRVVTVGDTDHHGVIADLIVKV